MYLIVISFSCSWLYIKFIVPILEVFAKLLVSSPKYFFFKTFKVLFPTFYKFCFLNFRKNNNSFRKFLICISSTFKIMFSTFWIFYFQSFEQCVPHIFKMCCQKITKFYYKRILNFLVANFLDLISFMDIFKVLI